MVTDEQVVFAFLAYMLVPIAFLFVWWLVAFLRRKLFKRGGPADEGSAEGES